MVNDERHNIVQRASFTAFCATCSALGKNDSRERRSEPNTDPGAGTKRVTKVGSSLMTIFSQRKKPGRNDAVSWSGQRLRRTKEALSTRRHQWLHVMAQRKRSATSSTCTRISRTASSGSDAADTNAAVPFIFSRTTRLRESLAYEEDNQGFEGPQGPDPNWSHRRIHVRGVLQFEAGMCPHLGVPAVRGSAGLVDIWSFKSENRVSFVRNQILTNLTGFNS